MTQQWMASGQRGTLKLMTNEQLFLSLGIPIPVNGLMFVILNSRISSVESRVETRMTSLEASMKRRFDLLFGKIEEIDTCLARLEERSAR